VERVDTDPPGFKTQELAKAAADKLTKKMEDLQKATAAAASDTATKPVHHTPPTGTVVKSPDTPEETPKETSKTGDPTP
jgi:hypothetical protein